MANEGSSNDSRFQTGLPDNANPEDKAIFGSFCLQMYERNMQWKNEDLSEYFADDFRSYTTDVFKLIDGEVRRKIRDLLRTRGVYVREGRNIYISDTLYEVVKDDIPWPENEPQESPGAAQQELMHKTVEEDKEEITITKGKSGKISIHKICERCKT